MASEKSSSVLQVTSSGGTRRMMTPLTAQVALRITAIFFTLIAISVTVTNGQSVVVFGLEFKAHYSYSTAFRFLVGANVVVCTFSVLSLIFVSFLSRPAYQHLKNYFFLFLHDTALMVLMISGCAAATAIGYVGKYGEKKMTWQPTCGYVKEFCNKMTVSLVFSYLAFSAYFLLTLMGAHNLMPRPTE
ncbi:hypothetical protein TB2_044600 [Malus domestica]